MARNKERLQKRNKKVRELFNSISKKNPKWRVDAVIDDVADQVFLEPSTVEHIIKGYGTYAY